MSQTDLVWLKKAQKSFFWVNSKNQTHAPEAEFLRFDA
jgi:hypothetical protein